MQSRKLFIFIFLVFCLHASESDDDSWKEDEFSGVSTNPLTAFHFGPNRKSIRRLLKKSRYNLKLEDDLRIKKKEEGLLKEEFKDAFDNELPSKRKTKKSKPKERKLKKKLAGNNEELRELKRERAAVRKKIRQLNEGGDGIGGIPTSDLLYAGGGLALLGAGYAAGKYKGKDRRLAKAILEQKLERQLTEELYVDKDNGICRDIVLKMSHTINQTERFTKSLISSLHEKFNEILSNR